MDIRVRLRRLLGATLLLISGMSAPSSAQPLEAIAVPPEQSAPLVEEHFKLPIKLPWLFGTRKYLLEALLVRPSGAGPFPLVVITHGTPRDVADRSKTRADWYRIQARSFARRGWAVAAVLRRSFGESEGSFDEGYGTCDNPDYLKSGRVAAEDLAGAVAYLRQQPFIDGSRVLGVGLSTGGMAWLAAAARQVPGLVGVINFAGGNGSFAPDHNCNETRAVSTAATFGSTTKVPTLWIYAENDHYVWPNLVRRMHAAYVNSGGTAELAIVPPFGEDGHALFGTIAMQAVWTPLVDQFLRVHGLPTWSVDTSLIDGLQGVHQEHFKQYLAWASEKAFVLALDGSWDWWIAGKSTVQDALSEAMAKCEQDGKRKCRPYAINFSRAVGQSMK